MFDLNRSSSGGRLTETKYDDNLKLEKQNTSDMKKLMPVSAKNKLKYHNTKKNKLLKNISREDIRLVYTFDKKLGSGAFGSVRIATKDGTSKKFSVKSIKRELIEGD